MCSCRSSSSASTAALLDALGIARTAEARDAAELLLARLGDLVEGAEAELVHRLGEVLVDALDAQQRADGVLLHLVELGLADDVELPAGELRREAHVLALRRSRARACRRGR